MNSPVDSGPGITNAGTPAARSRNSESLPIPGKLRDYVDTVYPLSINLTNEKGRKRKDFRSFVSYFLVKTQESIHVPFIRVTGEGNIKNLSVMLSSKEESPLHGEFQRLFTTITIYIQFL